MVEDSMKKMMEMGGDDRRFKLDNDGDGRRWEEIQGRQ